MSSSPQTAFPFFVGCSRSGTTLLRAMFDSHSQLAIPGESHFIAQMAGRRERYEQTGRFLVDVFLADLLAHTRLQQWRLPEPELRSAIVGAKPESLAEGIRGVFAAYAARRRKRFYGDKTPGYVLELPLLAELLPEARFVHIVRDGRDVALSLMEMEWAPGGLEAAARRWRLSIQVGARDGAALGPGRYMEVRYESLVDDPEAVLRAVCSFLGFDYEDRMLSYHERADVLTASFLSRTEQHLRLPPTKGLRDWRSQMSPEDVARFELLAGDALDLAGYPRSTG